MAHARTALYSGAGAAVASLAAIMILSRVEGHTALRAVNATSHIIHGAEDAPVEGFDMRRSLPGLLINVGSALFWGAVFAYITPPRSRSPQAIVTRAFITSAAAAILDYGLVPRRLRPGWELALAPRSVALALAVMGTGLAAGGLARNLPRYSAPAKRSR